MASLTGKPRGESHDADGRPAWGWLALALTAGIMSVRKKPKTGVWLGLGLAALSCWQASRKKPPLPVPTAPLALPPPSSREEVEPFHLPFQKFSPESAHEKPASSIATVEPDNDRQMTERGQSKWLLQVEPVPLLVEEKETPSATDPPGQGGAILDEAPLFAEEEPSTWPPNAAAAAPWLNAGAEIPDTIELPEVLEPWNPARRAER